MRNLLSLNSSNYKIAYLTPKSFEDTREAIAALRDGEILLCNLSELAPLQAQRIADFVSGGTCAIAGHRAVIGNGVFLFAPPSVQINAALT
jgi:cell division inhibitor SepF